MSIQSGKPRSTRRTWTPLSPGKVPTTSRPECTGTRTPPRHQRTPARLSAACVKKQASGKRRSLPNFGRLFFRRRLPQVLLRSRPDEHRTAETVGALQVLRRNPGVGGIELDRRYLRGVNDFIELRAGYTLAVDPNHRLATSDADSITG